MMKSLKIPLITAAFLVISLLSHGAERDSLALSFFFGQGDNILLQNYRNNEQSFKALNEFMTSGNISRIKCINIIGSSSPEGTIERNKLLTTQRAQAIRKYILLRWNSVSKNSVHIIDQTDLLSAWINAVEADNTIPRHGRIMEILKSNTSIPTKWANIQLLVGNPAQYMEYKIFPDLRNAVSCIITLSATTTDTSTNKTEKPQHEIQPQIETKPETQIETKPETQKTEVSTITTPSLSRSLSRPLPFALKTNLLFDAVSVLNIELEVSIGKHWSIAGELMFPWWLMEKDQNCIQIMSGNLEGRYWFGERTNRKIMTGWFAGLYAGGGYYDLELSHDGYQGEFFIAAGVSSGYVHTINKRGNLRMEYSLGVGYMSTNYRRYEAKFADEDNSWHLYRREAGNFSWFGPTRAKVSLVWMLDANLFHKKGGRK